MRYDMLDINFDPFPVLTSGRLVLRRLQKHDVDAIFKLRSDPEVMRYVNRPLTQTKAEAMEWYGKVDRALENNEGIMWCMALKENVAKKIGNIGLWRIEKENYRAELGYMIDPEYQGRNLTTEAIRIIIGYGFNKLKLHSIEARIDTQNLASAAVLKKTGFVLEAALKENCFYNGRFSDTEIYSVINPLPGF
jgi:[ribosomal protein S5]-alanine N-acetyltransferase